MFLGGFSPLKSTSYKPLQTVGLLKIVLYNNSLFRHNSIMILRKVLIMNEFMTFADGVYDCLADLKAGPLLAGGPTETPTPPTLTGLENE